jgi:hypothetical protein
VKAVEDAATECRVASGVYASAAAGAGLAWRTAALVALCSTTCGLDGGACDWALALATLLAGSPQEPVNKLTFAVLGPLLQRSPGAAASVRDSLARCVRSPHAHALAHCGWAGGLRAGVGRLGTKVPSHAVVPCSTSGPHEWVMEDP